jgi:hypothetical protein
MSLYLATLPYDQSLGLVELFNKLPAQQQLFLLLNWLGDEWEALLTLLGEEPEYHPVDATSDLSSEPVDSTTKKQ